LDTEEKVSEWKFNNDSILNAYKRKKYKDTKNIKEFSTYDPLSSYSEGSSSNGEIHSPSYDNERPESVVKIETPIHSVSKKKIIYKKHQNRAEYINSMFSQRSRISNNTIKKRYIKDYLYNLVSLKARRS